MPIQKERRAPSWLAIVAMILITFNVFLQCSRIVDFFQQSSSDLQDPEKDITFGILTDDSPLTIENVLASSRRDATTIHSHVKPTDDTDGDKNWWNLS
jgi:hypothetical protein